MDASATKSPHCHLNGELLPLAEARVSVLDRGFLFGDGVYDAIPVYGRRLFRFDAHVARLARSLDEIRIPNPHDRDGWLALVRALVATEPADDQFVYLQVTRGVAPRDHVMPPGLRPTVFAMTSPLKAPTPQQRRDGVACVSAADFRWSRGDIKSISLLGNVLARQVSADAGAVETVLLRDGWLTEASASNVWVVQGGTLLGPPAGGHLLDGIRVELFEQLCAQEGIPFARRPIAEAEVRGADELLLSSATKEVLAITTLDGAPVGHGATRGRPGPVHDRLHAAYERAKREQSI